MPLSSRAASLLKRMQKNKATIGSSRMCWRKKLPQPAQELVDAGVATSSTGYNRETCIELPERRGAVERERKKATKKPIVIGKRVV